MPIFSCNDCYKWAKKDKKFCPECGARLKSQTQKEKVQAMERISEIVDLMTRGKNEI